MSASQNDVQAESGSRTTASVIRPQQADRTFFDTAVAILMVIATVLLIWMAVLNITAPASGREVRVTRPEAPLPTELLSLEGAAMKGAEGAPVALIVYSDFQCPFCGQFARDVLPEIADTYMATGRLRLAFRHLPLEGIHPLAVGAAVAAECAGQQGQFWPMHDLLFKIPSNLSQEQYRSNATALGLSVGTFDACLAGAEMTAKVRADALLSQGLGLGSTPTLHIGLITPEHSVKVVEQLSGLPQVAALKKRIDTVLATVAPARR